LKKKWTITRVRGTLITISVDALELSLAGIRRRINREERQHYRADPEEVEFRKKKKENVEKLRKIRNDLKYLIKKQKQYSV